MKTPRFRIPRALKIAAGALLGILLLPGVAYVAPGLVGADHAYVVLSGSMEPFFSPGDLIWVDEVDPETLQVGDIITFQASPGSTRLYTHRVIEVLSEGGKIRYRTQGDANEDPDPFMVQTEVIVGKYQMQFPSWGHLLTLFRSRGGFFLLVAVPGALIIGSEMVKLYKELDALDRKKKAEKAAAKEAMK